MINYFSVLFTYELFHHHNKLGREKSQLQIHRIEQLPLGLRKTWFRTHIVVNL